MTKVIPRQLLALSILACGAIGSAAQTCAPSGVVLTKDKPPLHDYAGLADGSGGQYYTSLLKATSMQQCCALCLSLNRCVSWGFFNESSTAATGCVLFENIQSNVAYNGCSPSCSIFGVYDASYLTANGLRPATIPVADYQRAWSLRTSSGSSSSSTTSGSSTGSSTISDAALGNAVASGNINGLLYGSG